MTLDRGPHLADYYAPPGEYSEDDFDFLEKPPSHDPRLKREIQIENVNLREGDVISLSQGLGLEQVMQREIVVFRYAHEDFPCHIFVDFPDKKDVMVEKSRFRGLNDRASHEISFAQSQRVQQLRNSFQAWVNRAIFFTGIGIGALTAMVDSCQSERASQIQKYEIQDSDGENRAVPPTIKENPKLKSRPIKIRKFVPLPDDVPVSPAYIV